MAIENRNLPVGTRIWANYEKQRYVCTVEVGDEDGSVIYVLEDGSRHKSPSAPASRVMGGKAVNGWRFWTVEGDEAPATAKPKADKKGTGARKKQGKMFTKMEDQYRVDQGKTRYFCSACMDGFIVDGYGEPETCAQGHRKDNLELNSVAGCSALKTTRCQRE